MVCNCEPLIASVEVDETRPGATLVIWRVLPLDPTETTRSEPDASAPAKAGLLLELF